MEWLENQQGPENIVSPEHGFRSLLNKIEARGENAVVGVALALGGLLVAQVGALEAHSERHEVTAVHTASTAVHLEARIAIADNPTPTVLKAQQPKPHPKPKPKLQPPQSQLSANAPLPNAATNNLAPYIDLIPSLDQSAQTFPSSFPRVEEEKAYIKQLAKDVQVTPDGFKRYAPDTSRSDAFRSFPYSQAHIDRPQTYVFHWTGQRYVHGVDQLIHGMLARHTVGPNGEIIPDRVSVYDFAQHDGKVVYQLLPNARYRAAHANSLNILSQGIEMEAANQQPNRPSSEAMFDISPQEVEAAIYAAVSFCIQNGLPVNETSLITHYEEDLLYENSKYQASSGTLLAGATLGKFDLPKEFMTEVVLPKAKALHAELSHK